jgi:hypothetical protein
VGRRLGQVVAGQLQQLVDDALEAAEGVEGHGVVGAAAGGVLGPGLDEGAGGGQRAAQLVAGVGHEAPLALGRLLQPRQHLVHGHRQAVDLVAGARRADPLGQVPLGDLADRGADRLDRAERPADDQPDQGGDRQREHGHDQEERGLQRPDRLFELVDGPGGDHPQRRAGEGPGQDADRAEAGPVGRERRRSRAVLPRVRGLQQERQAPALLVGADEGAGLVDHLHDDAGPAEVGDGAAGGDEALGDRGVGAEPGVHVVDLPVGRGAGEPQGQGGQRDRHRHGGHGRDPQADRVPGPHGAGPGPGGAAPARTR